MPYRLLGLAVALLAASALTTPPSHAASELAKRLGGGEIIVTAEKVGGSKLPGFRMMGVVDAPADAVWRVVRRCEDWAGKMPRVARSSLLARTGVSQRCDVRVELPFPLGHLDSITEGQARPDGDGYRYSWRLIAGDYDHHRGEWSLLPFGPNKDRTLVVYAALIVPRVAVPDALLTDGQRKELPGIIKSLRVQTAGR